MNCCLNPDHSQTASAQTTEICQRRLNLVRLVSVDGRLLLDQSPRSRILHLLDNYHHWGLAKPLIMVAVHNEVERDAADDFQASTNKCGTFHVVLQGRYNERRRNAVRLYWQHVDPTAKDYRLNRGILHLVQRGGAGQPRFIDYFTGGEGTTCCAWTPEGGFAQAAVATGHCPVGCKICYLQAAYREPMAVALNLEDLAVELRAWQGYRHPVNFGAKSGLIEYDRWFCGDDGEGSIAQFIIDACAQIGITPYFLTKVAFPRYLRFRGTVQVGISLMPESIRRKIAPFGSPTEELLSSLAWAVSADATNPGIRLLVMHQYLDQYVSLLTQCRKYLGQRRWRLTVDIPRFASDTLSKIATRYPDLAPILARELDPHGRRSLREIAGQSRGQAEQIRPPIEEEVHVYQEVRRLLDRIGCGEVPISACKGDPQALLPLVEQGVLCRFPCACYAQVTTGPVAHVVSGLNDAEKTQMNGRPRQRQNVTLTLLSSSTSPFEPEAPTQYSLPTAQRCKSAPSEIEELDNAARNAAAQIDKLDKYRTAAYYRLGVVLTALRKHFPTGWEAHLEELGIEATCWKRTKCLAEHFENEDECRNWPLEEALALAGWGQKQKQRRRRPRAGKGIESSPGEADNKLCRGSQQTADMHEHADSKASEDERGNQPGDQPTDLDKAAEELDRYFDTYWPLRVAAEAHAENVGWIEAQEDLLDLASEGVRHGLRTNRRLQVV